MTSSLIFAEVSVTASPGTSVLTVEAIDIDEGNNGKVNNNSLHH